MVLHRQREHRQSVLVRITVTCTDQFDHMGVGRYVKFEERRLDLVGLKSNHCMHNTWGWALALPRQEMGPR